VRQVVDRHGGRIEVSSSPGGGARFSLWLPGVAAAVESPDIR
jgi:two-component system sensor histidine kinase MprB